MILTALAGYAFSHGFMVFGLLGSLGLILGLLKLPEFFQQLAASASNQMVQCVFYIVTYMRHTSNLELALKFASEHLAPPLSLDLKKVLWDVETENMTLSKSSLEHILKLGKITILNLIEAFHLVRAPFMSLLRKKRISMVEKALDVMLQETYEKMLRYSHELKSPITCCTCSALILQSLGLLFCL